jgi:hypothetical protein
LEEFKLDAWCARPELLPSSIDLHVVEPAVEGMLIPRTLIFPNLVVVSVSGQSTADPSSSPLPSANSDDDGARKRRRGRHSPPSASTRGPAHARLGPRVNINSTAGGPIEVRGSQDSLIAAAPSCASTPPSARAPRTAQILAAAPSCASPPPSARAPRSAQILAAAPSCTSLPLSTRAPTRSRPPSPLVSNVQTPSFSVVPAIKSITPSSSAPLAAVMAPIPGDVARLEEFLSGNVVLADV